MITKDVIAYKGWTLNNGNQAQSFPFSTLELKEYDARSRLEPNWKGIIAQAALDQWRYRSGSGPELAV